MTRFSLSDVSARDQVLLSASRALDLSSIEFDDLARDVMSLSSYYVSMSNRPSPWEQEWAQRAQVAYFHPLNRARALHIFRNRMPLSFMDGITSVVDWGAGTAAASEALLEALIERSGPTFQIQNLRLVERNEWARTTGERVIHARFPFIHLSSSQKQTASETLGLFCLSLTENTDWEKIIFSDMDQPEALAIIEPSNRNGARRLQAFRDVLRERGYWIWAPCTHQESCPLQEHSQSDWCHDRFGFGDSQPAWWKLLESQLPIKNETVTISYLLARRKKPFANEPLASMSQSIPGQDSDSSSALKLARVTGDLQSEKGKVRQMVCRGPKREFISSLSRHRSTFGVQRGDVIDIEESMIQSRKGSDSAIELRLTPDASLQARQLD